MSKAEFVREKILQNVCDSEPADPNDSETVCINYNHLHSIISTHLGFEEDGPKKKTITAHGMEHDDLITEPLEDGQEYHIVDLIITEKFRSFIWYNNYFDLLMIERQLAHHTQSGAVRHAEHMLGEE